MAVETIYENQDTISPRLNKQYTTVVNLGTVTVWYDRLKERLSEHADHIKTLGQFIRTPPSPPPPKTTTTKQQHTHTKWHPFKLNLSVTVSEKLLPHFALSVRETFFLFAIKKSQYVRWWDWEPEEHASFLCVKNWIHTWFSAWHTSRTCHSYQK